MQERQVSTQALGESCSALQRGQFFAAAGVAWSSLLFSILRVDSVLFVGTIFDVAVLEGLVALILVGQGFCHLLLDARHGYMNVDGYVGRVDVVSGGRARVWLSSEV